MRDLSDSIFLFLTGILFDATGSYSASFIFIGCAPLVAALFAGVAMIFEQRLSD